MQGNFAFIHDASEVKYEFYNNCNFTEVGLFQIKVSQKKISQKQSKRKELLNNNFFEVGEPFAEQPYAVAVQQVTKQKLSLITSIQNPSLIPQFGSIECSSKNRGVT